MPEPQPKPISTWERLLWAIAILVASYFGIPVPLMMGCVKPGPKPDPEVVVPPAPVIGELAKIVVVLESGAQNGSTARLVESLRAGKGEQWLAEQKIELVDIIDPGEVNSAGEPSKTVQKWQPVFKDKNLPVAILLDKNEKVIATPEIPESTTFENFVTLCTEHHGEPAFASLPYVDTDFADWPQFTPGDNSEIDTFEDGAGEPILKGREPAFGQAPRPPPGIIREDNPLEGEPIFEDSIPLIPRDQWATEIKAIDDAGGSLDLLVVEIKDQGQEGACVSDATVQGMQVAQARRFGRKNVVKLSAISLYKQVGRTAGSGSMVSDNLRAILNVGVLPLTNPENTARFPHTMPNTGFSRPYPDGWKETAKRFRGHEVFDVRTLDGFITALIRGFPVVYGRDGHSICAVRPVYRNGQLFVKYANSWSPNWGEKGFGYDSESKIRRGASWAFALRTNIDPDISVELPRPMIEANQAEPQYALSP